MLQNSIDKNQAIVVTTKTYFGEGGVEIGFPVKIGGGGWSFTAGSSKHTASGGFMHADDTFAMDLNLDFPTSDKDRNEPVHPIAPGVVVQSNSKWGWVLVKHSVPLTLANGERLVHWYSGYMHMANVIENNKPVTLANTLGNISNKMVDPPNNHLHFAIYKGPENLPQGDNSALKSIDFGHKIPSISGQIDRWIEWCGANIKYKLGTWWEEGETPCSY